MLAIRGMMTIGNESTREVAANANVSEEVMVNFLGGGETQTENVTRIRRLWDERRPALEVYMDSVQPWRSHPVLKKKYRATIERALGTLLPTDLHVSHIIAESNGGAAAVENYLLLGEFQAGLKNRADHFFAFLAGRSRAKQADQATREQNPHYEGPSADELYAAGAAWFARYAQTIYDSHPNRSAIVLESPDRIDVQVQTDPDAAVPADDVRPPSPRQPATPVARDDGARTPSPPRASEPVNPDEHEDDRSDDGSLPGSAPSQPRPVERILRDSDAERMYLLATTPAAAASHGQAYGAAQPSTAAPPTRPPKLFQCSFFCFSSSACYTCAA